MGSWIDVRNQLVIVSEKMRISDQIVNLWNLDKLSQFRFWTLFLRDIRVSYKRNDEDQVVVVVEEIVQFGWHMIADIIFGELDELAIDVSASRIFLGELFNVRS